MTRGHEFLMRYDFDYANISIIQGLKIRNDKFEKFEFDEPRILAT